MVSSVKKCCDKILESNRQNSILQELLDLKKQSSIIQHISAHRTKSAIGHWYTMVSRLPQSIYQFSRKGLILCLPTKVNMRLWSKSDNDHCSLCDQKQNFKKIIIIIIIILLLLLLLLLWVYLDEFLITICCGSPLVRLRQQIEPVRRC